MKPVSPVVPGRTFEETIIAESQDEYENLPAVICDDGVVVTRWQLSWRERLALLLGGSFFLMIWTFGQPLQPVNLQVNDPFDVPGPHAQ